MATDVKSLIQEGAELTDRALEELIPSAETVPSSIHGAMRHSMFAGGKRLRPVLAMQAAVTIAGKLPAGIARPSGLLLNGDVSGVESSSGWGALGPRWGAWVER